MKELPFNEENMRKFADLGSAIKHYSGQGIARRRIVTLYNQTFTISIGNITSNVRFLKSEAGAKFVEKVLGKSETRLKALENAVRLWNEKYKGSEFLDVKKSGRTKTSSERPTPTSDANSNQPEA